MLQIACAGLLALLGACDSGAQTGSPDVSGVVDACAAHPLLTALPAAPLIAGLSRRPPHCDWLSASVRYEGGDEGDPPACSVTITDLQAALPPESSLPGGRENLQQVLNMQRASHHAPIELQRRHRAFMLASNEALQSIGGVNYLPVVDVLPGGGTYVIAVPSVHDGPVEAGLTALVRDQRYGVQMQCFEKISDQAGARALYSPWIAALALEALP